MSDKTEAPVTHTTASPFGYKQSLLAGLLFVFFALALLFVLIPFGVDAPKKVKFAALHPAYYPRLVAYCLLGIGLLTSVFGLRDYLKHQQVQARAKTREQNNTPNIEIAEDVEGSGNSVQNGSEVVEASNYTKLLPLAVVLLAIFLLLPVLGFPLTAAIALLVIMPMAGERRWWLVMIIAVVLPMLLYLFFVKVANIPIPGGITETWLLKL